jgi:hypothetical protein
MGKGEVTIGILRSAQDDNSNAYGAEWRWLVEIEFGDELVQRGGVEEQLRILRG